MELVEIYRVRRVLLWYVVIYIVVAAALAAFGAGGGIVVNDAHLQHGVPIAASGLTGIAMFAAMFCASNLGIGLNRESQSLNLTWTKPIPRAVVAVRWIAVDAVALIAMYVFVIVVCYVTASSTGAMPVFDAPFWPHFALGVGVLLMWYALTTLVTARLPSWGPAIAGLLWPAALFLVGVAGSQRQSALTRIAGVLDVLNPIAYTSAVRFDASSAHMLTTFGPTVGQRAGITWALAALLAAVAVLLWVRREAR